MRDQIEKSARHLYGLVHARYIVTTRGQQKMVSAQIPQSILSGTNQDRWRNTKMAILANARE